MTLAGFAVCMLMSIIMGMVFGAVWVVRDLLG